MKRRALLSGIVPAVAGAAGACRSSVADVLTGVSQSSESPKSFTSSAVAWILIHQWFTTIMNNSERLRVPSIFNRVGKDHESLKNAVSKRRMVSIDFGEGIRGRPLTDIDRFCMDYGADTVLIENVRCAIAEHVASVLEPLDIVRVKQGKWATDIEICRTGSHVAYFVDVADDSGVDFRAYHVSKLHKLPMSMDIAIQSLVFSDSGPFHVMLNIDTKIAVDQHVGEIICLEGSWHGIQFEPPGIPLSL